MNARLAAMLALAVLMAGGAAWLAARYLEQAAAPAPPTQVTTTPVVVAAGDIPFASKIEAKHLKLVAWPSEALPAGALSDIKQVEGKVAQRSFTRDEPITRDRLRDHLGGSTLSAMIRPGLRAMSLRVDDVAGVAGFILPGNKVDILGSAPDKGSYTVLSGVNVLAIDQEASPEKNQPALVRSLTVEVSPEQAEVLDHAGHHGPLRFTLRNPTEEQGPQPAPHAVRALPPSKPVAPPPLPPPVPPVTQPVLTIIEWTGKGHGVIQGCRQWPCGAALRGDATVERAAPIGSVAPQGLLESLSTLGQGFE